MLQRHSQPICGQYRPRSHSLLPWRASCSQRGLRCARAAASDQLYKGKTAIVVGAGPAGSIAAMMLAKNGFEVEVYERRPEPQLDAVATGRAYIILLIPRGQAALQRLGIPLPNDDNYKSLGTVRHDSKGKVSVSKEEGNITFSRTDLAQFLVDQARARYPDSIHYNFQATATQFDIPGRKVTFMTEDGQTVQRSYDLLVGTDGVGSRVRAALQDELGLTVDISDSGREYKVYGGLRAELEPPEFAGRKGTSLHLYTSDDSFTTFTAHSNPDGTYSGTFSLKTGEHEQLISQAAYESLLRAKFPSMPQDWVPEVAAQAVSSKASSAGKRVKCSQLHGPGIILLGDAGHAVSPVFGQGANSALESGLVLDDVLQACKGDASAVPAAFSQARKEDVHALFWIDAAAFSFFIKKPSTDFFLLAAHVVLGTVLSKLLPFIYGSTPALLRLGSERYSVIYSAVRRDAALAVALAASLSIWLLVRATQ
ncbi:monooxygenase [Haematococcus lacustris]